MGDGVQQRSELDGLVRLDKADWEIVGSVGGFAISLYYDPDSNFRYWMQLDFSSRYEADDLPCLDDLKGVRFVPDGV